MTKPAIRRCAIYTRKSSEEGLEQEFNSLHAQREACEAYIKSQAGEGWRAIATAYDDGGVSGGTMARPGLTRLLADIALGKIDVVVVYKVDRLTRALSDFAKMVEIFDRQQVSFVSVTQAFNTTSSMGRLTLNVLLSFAQFEREVTGERIRDKIAASKRKGLWMGGNLPLGYDAKGRVLVVNEPEAEIVRMIFQRYLQLGSVHVLQAQLADEAVTSKVRAARSGRTMGGAAIQRGALYHLLSNRVYRGEITHKGSAYPGQHPAIVCPDVFDAVQKRLAAHSAPYSQAKRAETAPLTGKIFDAAGEPMCPSFSIGSGGRRYRYYVSSSVHHGARDDRQHIRRLPAEATETFILDVARRLLARAERSSWDEVRTALKRIEVRPESFSLTLQPQSVRLGELAGRLLGGERLSGDGEGPLVLELPVRLARRGGRSWVISADQCRSRPRLDRALVVGLRRAHELLRRADSSPLQSLEALRTAGVAAPSDSYDRKLVRLAFLAPDIQEAILAGRQPAVLNLKILVDEELPGLWEDQRARFGFAPQYPAPCAGP